MPFNGSGTFLISSTGQPVVTGTTISSTVFNALTADLATGLSTCLTKDGQTTPTGNIPMGGYKITGLGAAAASGDALSYGSTVTNTISQNLLFYAESNATQTVTSNVATAATNLGTEILDPNSNYDIVTCCHTPTVAGYYRYYGAILASGGSACLHIGASIFKNGSLYRNGTDINGLAGTAAGSAASVEVIVQMNGTTDYVQLGGTCGATGTVQFSSGGGCYFGGEFWHS